MSVADAIDKIEDVIIRYPVSAVALSAIIRTDLLPLMRIASDMREASASIDADGTPSQVGPSAADLRSWADMLRQVCGDIDTETPDQT